MAGRKEVKEKKDKVIGIRLTPKKHFGAELAARKHARSLASFAEHAVTEALRQTRLVRPRLPNDEGISVDDVLEAVWHPHEAERLANLALRFPSLLASEEELVWDVVVNHPFFWSGWEEDEDFYGWSTAESSLIREHLRRCWGDIKKVASGELDEDDLPEWKPGRLVDPPASSEAGGSGEDVPVRRGPKQKAA